MPSEGILSLSATRPLGEIFKKQLFWRMPFLNLQELEALPGAVYRVFSVAS